MYEAYTVAALHQGVPRQMPSAEVSPSRQSKVIIIKYQDILTALADVTSDLFIPCHKQRTGAPLDL